MKKYILVLSFISLSSCGVNKKISILEKKLDVLNDSISTLNSKFKIIDKPGDFYTSKNITFVGVDAGKNNSSSDNVFIGNSAGAYSYKTRNSLFVGIDAGINSSKGYGNVAVGNYAGQNINGNNNTLIGKAVANQEIGSNNVIIGTHAGQKFGNFSNKLVIESSDSKNPLIYGDFKTDELDINADLKIKGNLIINPTHKVPKEVKEGTIYYDSNTKKLKIWNGTKWENLN